MIACMPDPPAVSLGRLLLGEDGLSDAMAALGIDPATMSHLGSGTRGSVFDIGAGRIAKITTDQDEAEVAEYLAGRTVPGVWRVEAVRALSHAQAARLRELQSALTKFDEPLWVVVGQRTEDLPDRHQMRLAIRWLKGREVKDTMDLGPDQQEALDGDLARIAREGSDRDGAMAGDWVGYARAILAAYGELRDLGIGFHDLHAGNVRMGPAGPLLVDLGYSSAPADEEIEALGGAA